MTLFNFSPHVNVKTKTTWESACCSASTYLFEVFMPMFGNDPEFAKFGSVLGTVLKSLRRELTLIDQQATGGK